MTATTVESPPALVSSAIPPVDVLGRIAALQAATAASASFGSRDTSITAPARGRRRLGPVRRRESRSFIAVSQAGEQSTPDARDSIPIVCLSAPIDGR